MRIPFRVIVVFGTKRETSTHYDCNNNNTLFLWWLKPRMWLVDLSYNFECDWLIELSDNKLSDKKLDNWISGKYEFFKPITIQEIVIFMIIIIIIIKAIFIEDITKHALLFTPSLLGYFSLLSLSKFTTITRSCIRVFLLFFVTAYLFWYFVSIPAFLARHFLPQWAAAIFPRSDYLNKQYYIFIIKK